MKAIKKILNPDSTFTSYLVAALILLIIFYIVLFLIERNKKRAEKMSRFGKMASYVQELFFHKNTMSEAYQDWRYVKRRDFSDGEVFNRESDYMEAKFLYLEFLYKSKNSFFFLIRMRGKKDLRWLKAHVHFVSPQKYRARYNTLLEKIEKEFKIEEVSV